MPIRPASDRLVEIAIGKQREKHDPETAPGRVSDAEFDRFQTHPEKIEAKDVANGRPGCKPQIGKAVRELHTDSSRDLQKDRENHIGVAHTGSP